jgi:hypothetical protein
MPHDCMRMARTDTCKGNALQDSTNGDHSARFKPLKGYYTSPRPSKQTNPNHPWALVLKPLKECSTPSQFWGLLSSIDSRHTQPRALIVCQLLNRSRLRDAFCLTRAPMMSSKHPTPTPCQEQFPPRSTPTT